MPRARRKDPADGRSNNGGVRQGQSGNSYANRSDLRTQKISAPPSAQYGESAALQRSQQQVPMAGAPQAPTPAAGAPVAPQRWATPDDTPNLLDPSLRPDQPLEAGLPFGPGGGPELLGPPPMSDVEARLRALYAQFPTQELRELIRQQELMR